MPTTPTQSAGQGGSGDGQQPRMLGPYRWLDVISALRKSIKLGDERGAVYWLHVLLACGGKQARRVAARQLWIVAAEDVDDTATVLRAHAVHQMAGVASETDHLFHLAASMCRAPKWWESETGRAVDRWWAEAEGDLKRNPRPVPSYALDRHTPGGWERHRRGEGFDDRFSGTDLGRQKTAYLHLRDGRLDPEADVDSAFWQHWREYRRVLGAGLPDPVPPADESQGGLW